jgi:hypothetical protein
MATIDVLVVVDVEGTTTTGSLADHVWMIDSGSYLGTQEAGNELITYVNAGDEIVWALTAIDPGDSLAWGAGQPFSGNAVSGNNISPKPNPVEQDQYLAKFSVPDNTPAGTTYQYSMTLAIEKNQYTFDPFLKLHNAT